MRLLKNPEKGKKSKELMKYLYKSLAAHVETELVALTAALGDPICQTGNDAVLDSIIAASQYTKTILEKASEYCKKKLTELGG